MQNASQEESVTVETAKKPNKTPQIPSQNGVKLL